ncbi:hypothetical protein [Chitinophaga polysaccharea]|uniref:hypothetical protein n=1 Tax=Chitinophaga polysaccharea TaxID=1293035 RepID=UPI00115BF7D2|nr:hypothetical protein [Chitinophaga polysaccharea]
MADIKKRILQLSTGKTIKLFGNSIAIGKSLELGEGYAPNLFSVGTGNDREKPTSTVSNLHSLTAEELHEIADFNIRLWLELKENLRKYGPTSIKVFKSGE